jgi:hypothetical protein
MHHSCVAELQNQVSVLKRQDMGKGSTGREYTRIGNKLSKYDHLDTMVSPTTITYTSSAYPAQIAGNPTDRAIPEE